MVCEKNADTQHDFMQDAIRLVRAWALFFLFAGAVDCCHCVAKLLRPLHDFMQEATCLPRPLLR